MSAKSKRSEEGKPGKQRQPNLGQKEAERQQRSEPELSHMGEATEQIRKTAKGNGTEDSRGSASTSASAYRG